eukprot:4288259-Alexandrium_andersonii.AAC.1
MARSTRRLTTCPPPDTKRASFPPLVKVLATKSGLLASATWNTTLRSRCSLVAKPKCAWPR